MEPDHRALEKANVKIRSVRECGLLEPELLATAPNQIWSWSIKKLLGQAKWTYFYLRVILDVFSLYTEGRMVTYGQSSELARGLITDRCEERDMSRKN
jgi:putative transposase